MKASTNKCYLLRSSDESCTAKIEDYSMKNSTEVNMVLVFLFENHVTSACKNASQIYTLLQENTTLCSLK